MKGMETLKKLFPYELVLIVVFFGAPAVFLGNKTVEAAASVLVVSLLQVNPMVSFLAGFVFGVRNGFSWSDPVMTAVLFLLTTLLYFDISGALFALIYGLCALAGCFIGHLIKKKLDEYKM